MSDDGLSYGGSSKKKSTKKEKGPATAQNIRLTDSDDKYPSDLPPKTTKIDFDWDSSMNIVREVIFQGNRRVCWAIASNRSLSARLLIENKTDSPINLSVLHMLVGLIDQVDETGGLKNLEHLRQFMKNYGTIQEKDCKCPQHALDYKTRKTKTRPVLCTEKGKAKDVLTFKVEDFVIIEDNKVDERELIKLVNKGPVAVALYVYKDFAKFEGDGIYERSLTTSANAVDLHLLLLVGYGTKLPEGIHFWKVQNSMGTTWGNKGFGKIIRQISRAKGEPSMFCTVVYPKLLDQY